MYGCQYRFRRELVKAGRGAMLRTVADSLELTIDALSW
jgi:hypothetical protein